jgi:gamma-glutamylcyclotransferase (GGCT)/AIG2-like uncharacterized protein YtfP
MLHRLTGCKHIHNADCFRQPLHRFENTSEQISTSVNFSDVLYDSVLSGDYRELTADEIAAFLDSAAPLIHAAEPADPNDMAGSRANGLVRLLIDPTMPSDARVYMWYHPTYVVVAVALYAWSVCRETVWTDERRTMLSEIFRACTFRNLVGHGIDGSKECRTLLGLFAELHVLDFVREEPDFCPEFTEMIQTLYTSIEADLAHCNSSDSELVDTSWGVVPITAELKQIMAAANGYPHTIFVYGTLMSGQSAHHLLEDSICMGRYYLKNYALYDLGAFPGVKEQEGGHVIGEAYFISDEMRARLDHYEGEGSLYLRRAVSITSSHGDLNAEVYLYNGEPSGEARSEWKPREDDRIWYAAYGSNLSSERFSYYIAGGTGPNGKEYPGCRDRSPWRGDYFKTFSGRLYFANHSPSWDGGVAFFTNDRVRDYEQIQMRLYCITRGQLADLKRQEGDSPDWYGKELFLGIGRDNLPIYTLTSAAIRPQNKASEPYLNFLYHTLVYDFGYKPKDATRYLKHASKRVRFPRFDNSANASRKGSSDKAKK